MTYYKAFNEDLCCRHTQYTIGETTEIKGGGGVIKMCKNGIHSCANPRHCLTYYPLNSRFCEVALVGENYTMNDKTVSRGITVIREITGDELKSLLTGSFTKYWSADYGGGVKEVGSYKDGVQEGPHILYSGWWRTVSHYIDGKLDGMVTTYKKDSVMTETMYMDGKRDGPYKEYVSAVDTLKETCGYCSRDIWRGQVSVEGYYKNGKQEGTWVRRYYNGRPVHMGKYKDGKREGRWCAWLEDGTYQGHIVYDERGGMVFNKSTLVALHNSV